MPGHCVQKGQPSPTHLKPFKRTLRWWAVGANRLCPCVLVQFRAVQFSSFSSIGILYSKSSPVLYWALSSLFDHYTQSLVQFSLVQLTVTIFFEHYIYCYLLSSSIIFKVQLTVNQTLSIIISSAYCERACVVL